MAPRPSLTWDADVHTRSFSVCAKGEMRSERSASALQFVFQKNDAIAHFWAAVESLNSSLVQRFIKIHEIHLSNFLSMATESISVNFTGMGERAVWLGNLAKKKTDKIFSRQILGPHVHVLRKGINGLLLQRCCGNSNNVKDNVFYYKTEKSLLSQLSRVISSFSFSVQR